MSEPFGAWGRRPEVHSVPDTQWTRCDGCRHFTCIPQEKSRLHPWRFRCEKMGKNFEYKELFQIGIDDCPERKHVRRRNRW